MSSTDRVILKQKQHTMFGERVFRIGTGGQSLPLDPENFLNMGTSEQRAWNERRPQFFVKSRNVSRRRSQNFTESRSRESETISKFHQISE